MPAPGESAAEEFIWVRTYKDVQKLLRVKNPLKGASRLLEELP
jgi:hypothetical protein